MYFGSTHSFISPRCIKNLNLPEHPDVPLTVELATEKKTRTITYAGSIDFKLGEPRLEGILEYLIWGFMMVFWGWIGKRRTKPL